MELMMSHPLVRFLKDELALPQDSIALAVQHAEQTPSLLPMILWQYGLITLAQLEQIFDWLEQRNAPPATSMTTTTTAYPVYEQQAA
jgi:hypothetical protein